MGGTYYTDSDSYLLTQDAKWSTNRQSMFFVGDKTRRPVKVVDGICNGRVVDSHLTNRSLEFPDKDVPTERRATVIRVADETTIDNLVYRLRNNDPALSRREAEKMIVFQEQKELAEIIAQTISRPSELNTIDTQLPSGDPSIPASRGAYELWRFRTALERIGFADWARSITRSIGFVKSQNPRLPYY